MDLIKEFVATVIDAVRVGDWAGHWQAFRDARRARFYPPDWLDDSIPPPSWIGTR